MGSETADIASQAARGVTAMTEAGSPKYALASRRIASLGVTIIVARCAKRRVRDLMRSDPPGAKPPGFHGDKSWIIRTDGRSGT